MLLEQGKFDGKCNAQRSNDLCGTREGYWNSGDVPKIGTNVSEGHDGASGDRQGLSYTWSPFYTCVIFSKLTNLTKSTLTAPVARIAHITRNRSKLAAHASKLFLHS
jgi:hypothetical protein